MSAKANTACSPSAKRALHAGLFGTALALFAACAPRATPNEAAAPQTQAPKATPSPAATEAGQRLASVFAQAGCRGCHSAQGMAASTRLLFPKANASAQEFEQLSARFWQLVDRQDPSQSLLFRKPTKRTLHAGGERIRQGSAEETALLSWLKQVASGPREASALREVLLPERAAQAFPVHFRGQPSLLRRLSRDELVATMEVLLGSAPEKKDLPEDPRQGHSLPFTVGMPLYGNEIRALQSVLVDFSKKIAPQALERSGCSLTGAAQEECLQSWGLELAAQAFRRPLTPEEQEGLRRASGGATGVARDDLLAVEKLLVSVLFSPSFLYRDELGAPVAGQPGLRDLTAEEIATRISFLATLTPPDQELISAAKAGELSSPSQRVAHLERLLATERGQKAQVLFVLEWLGGSENKIRTKSDRYRRNLGDGFEAKLRGSAEATIRRVLSEGPEPTAEALLLTRGYLEDEPIVRVMQTNTSGKRPVGDTEATARTGLLMHPQIIAAHTKENGSSPFQIGAFIREAILCEPVPPPPPDAAASARTDVPEGLSTREALEYRTSAGPVCVGCHQGFAPLGYAFLPFDPVGRWMPEDPNGNGKAWDLSGQVALSTFEPLSFESPAGLVQALARHPQVHVCFAQAALEWSLGRGLIASDSRLLSQLSEVAKKTRGNLNTILRTIVASPDFARVASKG